MTDREWDLLRRHAAVLFDSDGDDRLTRLNEPDPETPAPRLFIARARTCALVRFRDDVPAAVAGLIRRLVDGLPGWDGEVVDPEVYTPVRDVLAGAGPVDVASGGPAFHFPLRGRGPAVSGVTRITEADAHLLDRHYPYTRTVLAWRSPVLGIVRDGAVVAACYTARRRATACEAGVATAEGWRGQGLAARVVAAWAAAVAGAGITPLYSTSWDNAASLRVAAKLGLEGYADTFSLT